MHAFLVIHNSFLQYYFTGLAQWLYGVMTSVMTQNFNCRC